ncbi:MAG: hypothetical protein Q8928_05245 [Bacteroidota bacterium]|nr:hypothetical protein [Bacteroidota bacterium]
MKKIALGLIAAFLLLTFNPYLSNAAPNPAPTTLAGTLPTEKADAKAKTLLLRLNEIKAMDKSTLTSYDKKNLRKEVRTIKRELRDISGGVYLSVGAIVLIILLLVILL